MSNEIQKGRVFKLARDAGELAWNSSSVISNGTPEEREVYQKTVSENSQQQMADSPEWRLAKMVQTVMEADMRGLSTDAVVENMRKEGARLGLVDTEVDTVLGLAADAYATKAATRNPEFFDDGIHERLMNRAFNTMSAMHGHEMVEATKSMYVIDYANYASAYSNQREAIEQATNGENYHNDDNFIESTKRSLSGHDQPVQPISVERPNYRPFATHGADNLPEGFSSEVRVAALVVREGSRMTPEMPMDEDAVKGWQVTRTFKQDYPSSEFADFPNDSKRITVESLTFDSQEEAIAAAKKMEKEPAELDRLYDAKLRSPSNAPERNEFLDKLIAKNQQEITSRDWTEKTGQTPVEPSAYRPFVAQTPDVLPEGFAAQSWVGAVVLREGSRLLAEKPQEGDQIVGWAAKRSVYMDEKNNAYPNIKTLPVESFTFDTQEEALAAAQKMSKEPISLEKWNTLKEERDRSGGQWSDSRKASEFLDNMIESKQQEQSSQQTVAVKSAKSPEVDHIQESLSAMETAYGKAAKSPQASKMEAFTAGKRETDIADVRKTLDKQNPEPSTLKKLGDFLGHALDRMGTKLMEIGGLDTKTLKGHVENIVDSVKTLGHDISRPVSDFLERVKGEEQTESRRDDSAMRPD